MDEDRTPENLQTGPQSSTDAGQEVDVLLESPTVTFLTYWGIV